MKALEKDRTRRYETANAFAMDVQRYLAGGRVVRDCLQFTGSAVVRRIRPQVIAASLVLFVLLAGLAGTGRGLLGSPPADHSSRPGTGRLRPGSRKGSPRRTRPGPEKERAVEFRDKRLMLCGFATTQRT